MKRTHDHYGEQKPSAAAQLEGTMFAAPINSTSVDSALTVPMQGEPKDARSFGHTFDARKPDAQWRRILRALADRPTMGMTRHELSDALRIPLASVCRAVGEKLLPMGYAEASAVITRESKYHAENEVLYATPKGRAALAQGVAA